MLSACECVSVSVCLRSSGCHTTNDSVAVGRCKQQQTVFIFTSVPQSNTRR